METTLWISFNKIGWAMAKDGNGNLVAKNPTLQLLERSLDIMFHYNWMGITDMGL